MTATERAAEAPLRAVSQVEEGYRTQAWQAAATRQASTLLCGVAGVTAPVYFTIGSPEFGALMVWATLAGLANRLLLARTDQARVCSHLLIGIVFSIILVTNFLTGGFSEPTFAWFYVVPMLAAAIVGLRGAWAWTGASLVAALGFWSLGALGRSPVSVLPAEYVSAFDLVSRAGAIAALGGIATSFLVAERRTRRALERSAETRDREARYVELLQHAAVAANEATSLAEALSRSARQIATTMGWQPGQLYQPGPDGVLQPAVDWLDDEFSQLRASTRVSFRSGEGLPGRVFASGRPAVVPEIVGSRTARARQAVDIGFRSAVALPVVADGQVVAVLEMGSRTPIPVDPHLDEVLAHIGIQLGRVTERASLHEQLRQSQKLEAVGQLAAGVAHEINNPMTWVRSNLNQLRANWDSLVDIVHTALKDDPKQDECWQDCVELIEESRDGVERTLSIVKDVNTFARTQSERVPGTDLNEVADRAVRVAATRTGPEVALETSWGELPAIACNPNQIQQVLVNLVVNALHAAASCVRVETGSGPDRVWVAVEDDGEGIDPADRERVFEPFFTTKPSGEGTGLGLYVSYEIVNAHGGEIRVESKPGGGARFEVRLPVAS